MKSAFLIHKLLSTFLEVEVSKGNEEEEAQSEETVARVVRVEDSVVYICSRGVVFCPVLDGVVCWYMVSGNN